MSGQLKDDGTLDTVISCTECGCEERYNYANSETDLSYDDWVVTLIEEFDEEHDCDEED